MHRSRIAVGGCLSLLLVIAVLVVGQAPAHASCAEPIQMEQALRDAHAVFVGTVTSTDFEGRLAEFAVKEVWSGDVGGHATVNGGPALADMKEARAEGASFATSVDRGYEPGAVYLVVAYGSDDGVLLDNACSNTQLFGDHLAEFRPDTAFSPDVTPDPGDPLDTDGNDPSTDGTPSAATPWMLVGIGAVLIIGVAGLRWMRHRTTAG